MTFWEHLDELRKVIFRSFAVLIVLMVVLFLFKETVFDGVVLAPLTDGFFVYRWMDRLLGLLGLGALEPFRVELVNIDRPPSSSPMCASPSGWRLSWPCRF